MISVLIVTWNRKDDILETIRSIYEQKYSDFEIIVVDNGSTDGTVHAIRQIYPKVRIVEHDQNIGVSRGRNSGIVVAKGDVILCLDSDAHPAADTLSTIVSKFQSEPEIGVINSKIIDPGTKKIGTAGWVYSEKVKNYQDSEFLSYSFSEGGAAIRREVFEKAGLFWERLFFGGEGTELSLRVLDAGYKILYYPASLVYHRASHQSRIAGSERDYLFYRNSLYIYLARFPWWMFVIFASLKTGAVLFRGIRHGYLRQILRGLSELFFEIPSLLKERKPIRKETALYYLKLQREHGQLSWNLLTWLRRKSVKRLTMILVFAVKTMNAFDWYDGSTVPF